MARYHQTWYTPKNPEKYIGKHLPYCRSSWEIKVCQMCDRHPNILEWASEAIKIPYTNPLTNRKTIYVPDFLVRFQDQKGRIRTELWEVKPKNQTSLSEAKRESDRLALVVNAAKWEAAKAWSSAQGIFFRVITEDSLFRNYGRKR